MREVHPHPPEGVSPRNATQAISIGVGFLLFFLGLAGMLSSSFAGLHFGFMHAFIISCCGAILFYFGYKDDSLNAFLCCVGFGLFLGSYSIIGFVLGEPGVPAIGHQAVDPYTIKIIPGFHEFGRTDHVLNGVIALVLLGGALDWAKVHSDRVLNKRSKKSSH